MADFLPPSRDQIIARRSKTFVDGVILMAKGNGDALSIVKAGGRYSPELQNFAKGLVEQSRAAVGVLNTGESSGDALISYGNVSASWIASLVANGVFDRAVADMVQLPLMVQRSSVVTDAFAADTIEEAYPKKVGRLTLDSLGILRPKKAVGLTVVSSELLRFSNATDFIDGELRKAVITAIDSAFLTDLINNTTPISGSADPADNFAALVAAITYGANAKLYYVVSPREAGTMATARGATGVALFPQMTPTGGTISGITTLVSDALPTGKQVMFDATQIGANAGEIRVDTSGVADIELDDSPTMNAGAGSPDTPTATTVVNLWQTNGVAIKIERYWLSKLLRTGAVASVSGVSPA